MESSFEGVFLDQSKCSKLSMEEKRELVYEISKWPGGAHEMLQSWSRHEILEVLCAELGKERKYTGLTKLKIIENLMKIVSEKKSLEHAPTSDLGMHSSSTIQNQKTAKRQRKTDHPSRLPFSANNLSVSNGDVDLGNTIYCKNLACRATLGRDDPFCKRCSCCICYQYDDNKDPSLWLVCGSELPFEGVSCGMSCHLECALKHERSGISKEKKLGGLDGSYFCVSCGKVNDLIGCCRKQLVTAKLTRRVDILCYRVALSQKLLCGTVKYRKIFDIVDDAAKKLEVEVGPLTGIPVKMGRGIVNRLYSGPEVQKLCTMAAESLDSMFSTAVSCMFPDHIQGSYLSNPAMIRVDNVGATSLTVILGPEGPSTEEVVSYTLWHRKANETDYPAAQTCTLHVPNTRFVITGLIPASEYVFKVISQNGRGDVSMYEARFSTDTAVAEVPKSLTVERTQSPATNCSSLSNPSSVEDENNNITPYTDLNENRTGHCFNYHTDLNKTVSADTSKGTESTMVDSVSAVEGKHRMAIDSTEQVYDVLKLDNGNSQEVHNIEEMIIDNRSSSPVQTGLECVPFVGSLEGNLPITPCKMENSKDGHGRSGRPKPSNKDDGHGKGEKLQAGSGDSSKKSGEERPDEGDGNCPTDRDFEFYVKVIRWLECEGHIEKNFRQKFLTWYTLRATPQEVRVVKVFVDTFMEDPASLAGQLVDTFSDSISSTRSTVVQTGFCMKLWH